MAEAVRAAQTWRSAHQPHLKIEVEARTLAEVEAVLEIGGVDVVLLDNMVGRHGDGTADTSRLAEAVARVDGQIATEASGNVTLETVSAIAATGVDYISSGALTHSVRALDVSLAVTLDDADA
jgi:nicotinate-nucleotide pyrophosphorylase (carboxylating)